MSVIHVKIRAHGILYTRKSQRRRIKCRAAFYLGTVLTTVLANCLPPTDVNDACPPEEELFPCKCLRIFHPTNLTGKPPTVNKDPRATNPASTKTGDHQRLHNLTAVDGPFQNVSLSMVVECDSPPNLLRLEDAVVNSLHRKWVDKLVVSNVPPKKDQARVHLPNRWLKNVRVKQFVIRNTLLYGDFIGKGKPFEDQSDCLVWFAANNCSLEGYLTIYTNNVSNYVNMEHLERLHRLEEIDLSRNRIVHIAANGFQSSPNNLTTIILSHNSIRLIDDKAFYYVYKLRYLDLSHNHLEKLTRNIFQTPTTKLEHINLSWNHIVSLPPDFFKNMPALSSVNVKSNFLYSMPESLWSNVWNQLKFLDISENFVECDCSLSWLVKLNEAKSSSRQVSVQDIRGQCGRAEVPGRFLKRFSIATLARSSLQC